MPDLSQMVTAFILCVLNPLHSPFFHCSKLLQEGLTHHEISERVKEKASSENESIYGTLYGTLEEDE